MHGLPLLLVQYVYLSLVVQQQTYHLERLAVVSQEKTTDEVSSVIITSMWPLKAA